MYLFKSKKDDDLYVFRSKFMSIEDYCFGKLEEIKNPSVNHLQKFRLKDYKETVSAVVELYKDADTEDELAKQVFKAINQAKNAQKKRLAATELIKLKDKLINGEY